MCIIICVNVFVHLNTHIPLKQNGTEQFTCAVVPF